MLERSILFSTLVEKVWTILRKLPACSIKPSVSRIFSKFLPLRGPSKLSALTLLFSCRPFMTFFSSHLYFSCYYLQVVGLDLVDDESKPERRPTKHMPTPEQWTNVFNPAYAYYVYYCYANLYTLNKVITFSAQISWCFY